MSNLPSRGIRNSPVNVNRVVFGTGSMNDTLSSLFATSQSATIAPET